MILVERYTDVGDFVARAGAFLEAREAEHNLIFGICSGLTAGQYDEPPYLAAVLVDERVVACAVRTPPWRLVLSEVDDPAAVESLVADLAGRPLPGMMGPVGPAAAFARMWSERTGVAHSATMSERIYRLTRVVDPHPVPGRARVAETSDRERLVDWQAAFEREALGEPDLVDAGRTIDRWLSSDERDLWVWDDDGIVSMCGASRTTPNGARIGPVYTPPDIRGRGYASGVTAAASRSQLGSGRRFCFLFTDLANRTSNHIYEAIGYEPVRDVEVYRFGDPASARR